MGIMNKKLKVKKNGVVEEINIYDNQSDVGPDFIRAGGGYVKLGNPSDPNVSKIRVKKNGSIKAVLKSGLPPYIKIEIHGYGIVRIPVGSILIKVTLKRDKLSYLVRLHKNTTSIKIIAQRVLGVEGDLYTLSSVINQTEPKVAANFGKGSNAQDIYSEDAIIEYPVQDDEKSEMYDMNQIIYENGFPYAKQIR